MTSTQMAKEQPRQIPGAKTIDTKLEAVFLRVSDVDRAKSFYTSLGWRMDGDFSNDSGWRGVQLTPTGSFCSIHLGKGDAKAAPGSAQGLFLVVDDLEAARAELIGKGVAVSEPYHVEKPGGPPLPGVDPEHHTYASFASFSDPDGNGWVLQEVRARLPGRGLVPDVATLTELLRETETAHGAYESTAPPHHWSGWYAAYIVARERGRTGEESARDAALHMERLQH